VQDFHFGLFGDRLGNRFGHTRWNSGAWFAPNVLRAWKSLWPHPMDLLGDMGQIETRFGPFGNSVKLDAR
jgi:hypothetical protein